jgi:acetyl-CoA acyltransferase
MAPRAKPLGLAHLAVAVRSPLDRHHGALARRHPADLLADVLQGLAQRAGDLTNEIDALVVGCAEPVGGQSGNVARAAAMAAGWPESLVAWTLDAGASAGHLALHQAVALVRSGQARAVVAAAVDVGSMVPAGAAAMGRHPYGRPWGEQAVARSGEAGLVPPALAAEHIALRYALDASVLVSWSERSRARAQSPPRGAASADEIVAVTIAPGDDPLPDPPRRRGQPATSTPRRQLDTDGAFLRPLPVLGDAAALTLVEGVITAASIAPAADGAAAVLVTATHGDIVIESIASAGCTFGDRTHAVAEVVRRSLALASRPGASEPWYDLDEAWTVDVLAVAAQLGLDPGSAALNPRGGALALGNPGAVGGLRAVVSAAHALGRGPATDRAVIAGGDGRTAAATVLAFSRP